MREFVEGLDEKALEAALEEVASGVGLDEQNSVDPETGEAVRMDPVMAGTLPCLLLECAAHIFDKRRRLIGPTSAFASAVMMVFRTGAAYGRRTAEPVGDGR